MTYGLDQLVADCRATLARDPGPSGREEIRVLLERLLRDDAFLARHCSDATPPGLHILHDEPAMGFQVLAHINANARVSPPHDHGASWAIYGQASGYTDVTEWTRLDDGADPARARLEARVTYRLEPGHAHIYQDRMIHSIDYPDRSRFVRVTGTNLDRIARIMFDLKTGKVTQMLPQQAS
jgi:predicted metal-dependent enzyme (double-stranded beta helix superfamily)